MAWQRFSPCASWVPSAGRQGAGLRSSASPRKTSVTHHASLTHSHGFCGRAAARNDSDHLWLMSSARGSPLGVPELQATGKYNLTTLLGRKRARASANGSMTAAKPGITSGSPLRQGHTPPPPTPPAARPQHFERLLWKFRPSPSLCRSLRNCCGTRRPTCNREGEHSPVQKLLSDTQSAHVLFSRKIELYPGKRNDVRFASQSIWSV